MPNKKMSTLSPSDFRISRAALNLNAKQLAAALGVTPSAVSQYQRGRQRIPAHIATTLHALLVDHYDWMKQQPGVKLAYPLDIHDMLVQQNILNSRGPAQYHHTKGLLKRRSNNEAGAYPIYCMTRQRWEIYVQALSRWQLRVTQMQQEYPHPGCQRAYRIDLANLRYLASTLPRQLPYDVQLERTHWPTVSSALLHLATDPIYRAPAKSLHHHWEKHRGVGFRNNKR